MGYDERFIRMWRYYLIASELSLSDMPHVLFHVQLQKHQTTVPITRDYLYVEVCAGTTFQLPGWFHSKEVREFRTA